MKKVLIIDKDQKSSLELARFLKGESIIDAVDDYVDCCVNCEIRPVGGYAPIRVDTVDEGLEKIKESEDLKVVLLNVKLSEGKELEALKKIKHKHPEVMGIVMGAGAETARKATASALDAAFNRKDVHRMLDRAFCRLYAPYKIFRPPTEEVSKNRSYFIGESEPMFKVNKKIGRVARDTIPVLIAGETGTGKELVASLIHDDSKRARGPFISIDCGAVSEALLETELFGYDKGAFTHANPEGRLGRFRLANRGTLFLDEIGNMTAELQKKLLRVLQTQEVQPVNSDQIHKVDVRVITATNQPLAQMVAEGKFRKDLFYRLKGYEIKLPPLEERKEDIGLLVEHFLQQIQGKEDHQQFRVSEKVMELLQVYDWPGNVRELERCIESAAVNSQGEVILPKDLPPEIRVGERERISEVSVQEIQALETAKISTYENLFDLPVVGFCRFISDAENITETQIASWSEMLSHYAHRGVDRAEHEIHSWTQAWKDGLITSADLLMKSY